MKFQIICFFCGEELKEAGALLFSPPVHNSCEKRHICVECWPVVFKKTMLAKKEPTK